MPTTSSRGLVLNIAPIEFEHHTVTAHKITVDSSDAFPSLREQYRSKCLVRRVGEVDALLIPLNSGEVPDGEPVELRLEENLGIVSALVENSLLDYLYRIGRVITRRSPVTFLDSKTDLLETVGRRNSTSVSVRPVFEIQPRVFRFDSLPPFVGVAISLRITRSITDNVADMLQRGWDISGLYVGKRFNDRDSRINPRLVTLGRVANIIRNELVLEDCRQGNERLSATEAYLDASPEAVARILSYSFTGDVETVKKRLFHAENELHSGPNKHDRLQQICGFFQKLSLELLPGVSFHIKPFLSELPPVETCSKPTYVFDPTGRQTKTWHDGGLSEFGPYTRKTFTPSKPRICIICQQQKRGRVEQFVQKFLHGIPVNGGKRAVFPNGLLGKYRIENCSTNFFETEGPSAAAYKKAALTAIQRSTDEDFRWDLALVQVEDSFKALYGDDSPYFATKSIFFSHQIPVQDFRTEITAFPSAQLQYALNNMGLATYAKMGGIPWLLEANPTIAHELVIGIGSAQLNQGRFGEAKRLVGITTVFSGDGKYRLSNVSKAVSLERYGAALLESLKETVSRIRNEMNWQSGDHVRLVFHAFKPIKYIEADAVKAAMQELGEFDLDYAFLHVAEEHPLMLFDTAQKGVFDYETKRTKGIYAPTRGMFIHLSDDSTLLTLVGANEVKTARQGVPSPILLKLHPSSNFRDMTYLARQVFLFACHSWRSFFPSELPVTIKYSDLIARLLGNLETLSNWNPEVMVGRIANTRWFL